jgi:acyl carrier protein
MQADIRSFILALLGKKNPLPPGFDGHTDFIAGGIIDSMAIIKFLVELEAHFDIAIDEDELASEQFRTVDGLVTMIAAKTAHQA